MTTATNEDYYANPPGSIGYILDTLIAGNKRLEEYDEKPAKSVWNTIKNMCGFLRKKEPEALEKFNKTAHETRKELSVIVTDVLNKGTEKQKAAYETLNAFDAAVGCKEIKEAKQSLAPAHTTQAFNTSTPPEHVVSILSAYHDGQRSKAFAMVAELKNMNEQTRAIQSDHVIAAHREEKVWAKAFSKIVREANKYDVPAEISEILIAYQEGNKAKAFSLADNLKNLSKEESEAQSDAVIEALRNDEQWAKDFSQILKESKARPVKKVSEITYNAQEGIHQRRLETAHTADLTKRYEVQTLEAY